MLRQGADRVYRQPDMAVHPLPTPYKRDEEQMQSNKGWYTVFAGKWCWVFNRKGKFYALIEGKGQTPPRKKLSEVVQDVTDNIYRR